MSLTINYFKLRKHISQTAIDDILDGTGESSISIFTYNDDFITFMDQMTHFIKTVFDDTLTRCLVPTAETADTGMDLFISCHDKTVWIVLIRIQAN